MKCNPIIVVDDDIDDIHLIKEALNALELKNDIIVFHSAIKAFDFIKDMKGSPFFILSDVNMPQMDGIELRQRICENEQLKVKAFPFIFMTTGGSSLQVQKAYTLSMQGYFIKPSSFEYLKDLIRSIVDYWSQCQHPNSTLVLQKIK